MDIVTVMLKMPIEFYAGEATAEDLGVKAVDAKTLEITLNPANILLCRSIDNVGI